MSRIRPFLLMVPLVMGLLLATIAPVAAQGSSYVVQPGDTLYSIATRHGTSADQLMALNGLTGPTIYVGQRLTVPGGAAPSAPASGNRHIVSPGETLFSIAVRHGTTVDTLMALNGLTSPTIYAGQALIVAGSAAPAAPSAPASGTVAVVGPGDTLFSIATRHGTSVAALKQANGLTSDLIYLGQRLTLPGPGLPATVAAAAPTPPVYYYVQPGDTLTRIAAQHGVSVGALAQLNGLRTGDWVFAGQRLLVPSGVYAPAPPPAAPPAIPGQPYYHIVRPGETLTHIAMRYGSSVPVLVQANRLPDPSHIFVGQRLAIPGHTPPPSAPRAPAPAPSRPYTPIGGGNAPYVPPGRPSEEAPTVVKVWRGWVTQSTCKEEDSREFRSIVRVNVEGRAGQTVDLFAMPMQDSTFITWGQTGNKAELGPHAVEFAPLGAGNYVVSAPGLGTVPFYLDGQCTVNINFAQVTR